MDPRLSRFETFFSMDAKLQLRIQRYGWDRAADHYELAWKHQLEPAQTRMLALAAIRPGDHVLDIACGTGLVTFRAAEMTGPTGRVVGLDISGEMVERAKRRAAELDIENVLFKRSGRRTSLSKMKVSTLLLARWASCTCRTQPWRSQRCTRPKR